MTLPPLAARVDQLWHLLLDLGETLTVPWTLVVGQMVLLHALEHGQVPAQISQDGDVLGDVGASPEAILAVVPGLERSGLVRDGISADGVAHRYIRVATPPPVTVDVLAPEVMGTDTSLTTTPPPCALEKVPGGGQAY